jgi:hypothetical protein
MHRAQEARRPPPLPQHLAQRPHTGGQRLVTDKRVGPQLLQEFLLGDDPRAMRQQVGEYLKHLAPELHRCTCVLQLLARRIEDIVTKAVPHRPALSAARALIKPRPIRGAAIPCGSSTPSSKTA